MVKILIIQEGKYTNDLYHQLVLADFQVRLAKSGVLGLNILSKEIFDLVLLDMMLPDMHGLELIRKYRTSNPHTKTPIVILSDTTENEIIKQSFALGIKGYLIKTNYTPAQIIDRIKAMMVR